MSVSYCGWGGFEGGRGTGTYEGAAVGVEGLARHAEGLGVVEEATAAGLGGGAGLALFDVHGGEMFGVK